MTGTMPADVPVDQPTYDRIAFLRGLQAVRRFRPNPVPAQAVADIQEVARWTGSTGSPGN